jgi:LmbE family N-acetylglucosaminyl deacetylase
MASIFATMAYHWAGRTNRYTEQLNNGLKPHRAQKLYYTTATFSLPDRQPVSLSPPTTIINIGEYLETKIRAFKTHTTQSPLFSRFENNVRLRGAYEMFHLAASVHPGPIQEENDLLTGVVGNQE